MTMRLFEHFLAVEGLVANKKAADASGHRRTFELLGCEPKDLENKGFFLPIFEDPPMVLPLYSPRDDC